MKNQLIANQVVTVESFINNRSVRDANINKVEILNKVKALTTLPDDMHVTVEMAADYYEVGVKAIKSITLRHRDELESDGLKVLKGYEFENFVSFSLKPANIEVSPKTRSLTLIPRRALLRIGMLLRDSEVAKQVRSYLLNVEEIAQEEAPEINQQALLQLLEERDKQINRLKEDNLMLYEANRILAPKAEIFDHFMSEKNSYSMDEVAKVLKVEHLGRNKLFDLLRNKGVLLKDDQLNQRNVPHQKYIDAGYFVVVLIKKRIWDDWKGRRVVRTIPVTRVLPKGIKFIRKLLLQSNYQFNIAG